MAEIIKSVGTWHAHVVIEGKTPQLHISGNVPTNAEKPVFELEKSIPQGFNPLILLLDLKNAELIDLDGQYTHAISRSFAIGSPNQYTSVYIKGVASFKVSDNIGNWKATVRKEDKTPFLIVDGDVPTNGEKPLYRLEIAESQGIVHEQLILLLRFGNLANPVGKVIRHVHYKSDRLLKEDEYTSIMVIDGSGRVIARQLVEFI